MQQIIKNILILIPLFFLVFSASSQNINLKKKITIVAKNKPLKTVLDEIQSKTKIKFSYNTQAINAEKKVTLIARNKSVKNILKNLFAGLNIEFTPVEKQIVLKKKHTIPEKKIIVKKETPKLFIVSGYIYNEYDGEILIGAGISLLNSYKGTMTNEYGFYSLSLPEGKYILNFSYIGFENKQIELNLNSDKKISQKLKLDASEIEIVVVTEDNNIDIFEKTPLKQIKLTNKMITSNVGLAGEADVVKSIQSIPGITSFGDGSVLFYVRGGNKDQNLIMIDDAPVYNPSHLFGFFSAIAPDAVKDIKIYKNNFPIKYGGRLSSLIDIKTKDGNLYKWGFSGKTTPFTGSYTIEGPIKKEKSTILINLRRSHINWLIKNSNTNINFYDFHIKFNRKFNRKNRLFFSMYKGKDFLTVQIPVFGTAGLSWQNNALSLRWNHLYSDKLFSNITLHTSKYDYFLYYSVENNNYWNSFIGNFSLRNDFTYFSNPENKINFGLNINTYFFNPGNLNNDFFGRSVYASDAIENILYFGHDKKFKNKININYGIRLISWNNIGPATIFSFDDNFRVSDTVNYPSGVFNTSFNLEPQASISYSFSKSFIAKISYDRHIQHLQLLSNSISPFTTLDVWMPSGPNIKTEKSHQFVAGINKYFSEINISTEVYYKTIQNLIDYDDHANMLLNPYIEGELRFGDAYSYGIEFLIQKQKGNFNFYSGYTYSRIFATVSGVNNGNKFPARHDKPHNLNINISYKTEKWWTFSMNWVFSSGMRFSSPTGFYYYRGYNLPVYAEKNNDKLPGYHRLDISAVLNLNKKETARYKHDITFSIFNFYGRNNIIAVNFNKIQTDKGNFQVPTNLISEKEIIPTSKYLLGFMPSIAYSFKFR
ncbi:MAG: TonB-dependent receptor [Bacteroidales bacterium]|nr:TonB-dependent receptor [Bacteroidales bacterium]